MTDINELIHAIGLAEKLAAGVAREADRFPTEDVTRIREALASARIRAEEIGISADLICNADEAEDRLKCAVEAIAASEGKPCVPFRPTGRIIVSDEVGSSEMRSSGDVFHFTLRLDVLRAREALTIAEQLQVRDLAVLREAVIKAEVALAKAMQEDREVPVPVNIVLDAPGEPIEVFVADQNLARLREAIGELTS